MSYDRATSAVSRQRNTENQTATWATSPRMAKGLPHPLIGVQENEALYVVVGEPGALNGDDVASRREKAFATLTGCSES